MNSSRRLPGVPPMAGSSAPGRFNGNRDACRYFRWHLRGKSRRPCGNGFPAATIRRTRLRARPKALPWALRVATKVHGTWAPYASASRHAWRENCSALNNASGMRGREHVRRNRCELPWTGERIVAPKCCRADTMLSRRRVDAQFGVLKRIV